MITREENEFLELAQAVMCLPTAPFCENIVADFVKNFASRLPSVSLNEDAVGNLLLVHEGTQTKQRDGALLIATAHMDHPGLVLKERLSERDFLFLKKGGIPMQFAKKAKVNIYSTDQPSLPPIAGKITAVDGTGVAARRSASTGPGLTVRVAGSDGDSVQSGSFAMWDLVPFEKRKRRIRGRACDDLAGVACGLFYLLSPPVSSLT